MKKIFKILLLILIVGNATTNEVKSQSVSVSLSVFQNSLKPYGRWVNHGTYGQVWISNTRGFKPYSTGGHWTYTDYGWTWVSDYNWGWAPFHYGRWSYERSLGWYWVPGYEWAPAWVAWRGGGDVYGWAPLSPGLNLGVGVSFGNQIPYDRWVFAPHRYITSPYIGRHYIDRRRNITYIKNTTIVNNVTVKNNVHYVAGPRKDEVERLNHTKIKTLIVANSAKPGKTVVNKNTVNVYKPVINNDNTTVNNNNKTVVNKNSNNKTVTQNNTTKDNKTVNKNNTTVNNNKQANNDNNKQTEKNNVQNNKPVVKEDVQKPPVKKPVANSNTNKQKTQQVANDKKKKPDEPKPPENQKNK